MKTGQNSAYGEAQDLGMIGRTSNTKLKADCVDLETPRKGLQGRRLLRVREFGARLGARAGWEKLISLNKCLAASLRRMLAFGRTFCDRSERNHLLRRLCDSTLARPPSILGKACIYWLLAAG